MTETGFSIWLEARCSTQAEAAQLLGITDRSVRRYKEGERKVPKPVAKMMIRLAVEYYLPEMPINTFHVDEWPDRPQDARALLGRIREMGWAFVSQSPDTETEADIRINGPQKSYTRTNGPHNPDMWTAGPHNSDSRTDGPFNSDRRTAGPLRSWFSWWRSTAGPTG